MGSRLGLGIDIGSVAVAAALVEERGGVVWSRYAFHRGDVDATLEKVLADVPKEGFDAAATTTSQAALVRGFREHDGVLCAIQAAARLCPDRRALFLVGGERFHLVRFHNDGRYRDTRSNTSCAAGTGSFLDQQAHRLGLAGARELVEVAAKNRGAIPQIASRCSVFAKTDLIHAQQEGYDVSQICDGLASGVAHNIVDTVVGSSSVPAPAYIAGGVALNPRVIGHLSEQIGLEIHVPPHAELFGAVGAGILSLEGDRGEEAARRLRAELSGAAKEAGARDRTYCHAPLAGSREQPGQSLQPASSGAEHREGYLFTGERAKESNPVETELFEADLEGGEHAVYLGVDIGSTSTKAVLMARDNSVLAGFYTRTAGRPVEAAQALLEAVADLEEKRSCRFEVLAAGTTGSGRKLIGAVLGADLVLDEITAHARAATEIDPRVDTIIEIGGQDAKFTTLRRGIVTFSHMNTVCAAGTGSFIEEQAAKLGVGLRKIADRACLAEAPRTSDRCTVFMERDINHLLTHGYAVDEILAAVLHSVVENYLHKVATPGLIGDRVCFQGATARNHALVAAFRRKLERPVLVSRYCHLAGALGVALVASEECKAKATGFKGLGVFREDIAMRTEVCRLCANNCKIRIAKVSGRNVAFGFACGRDHGDRGPSGKARKAFDGVEQRKKRYAREDAAVPAMPEYSRKVTFGIPYALFMVDDADLWRRFFDELGVRVLVSEPSAGGGGRRFAGAEFCAPLAELHGHVESLLRRTDYVFLPHQLRNEERCTGPDRVGYPEGDMCYYTQFASTVLQSAFDEAERIVSPLLGGPLAERGTKRELASLLGPLLGAEAREIHDAYDRAQRFDLGVRRSACETYKHRAARREDVEVVLVGRPYTILSPRMNKRIPSSFASLGVPITVQDEIPESELDLADAARPEEMDDLPWSYASRILSVARYAATVEGLYPVFVTSFRCSPDAFVIDAFREVLDAVEKPYLILQVDDLDSAVGYETRIEAGVRAFRNHLGEKKKQGPWPERDMPARASAPPSRAEEEGVASAVGSWDSMLAPVKSLWGHLHALREKTLLVPRWDRFVCELLVEMLRSRGVDARLLHETPELIARGMRHNSGQCIPVNIVAEECIDYVRRERLAPAETALWVPRSTWACNIPMYPSFLRRVLRAEGLGDLEVYRGVVTFSDIDPTSPAEAYLAFLLGGLLRRFGCMIRPHEDEPGSTDRALEESLSIFREAFRAGTAKDEALQEATRLLDGVSKTVKPRPKVGIFGDFYARDNDIFNQGLIRTIEEAGGEVVTTPYSEYARIISSAHFKRLLMKGNIGEWTMLKALLTVMEAVERRYRRRLGAPYGATSPVADDDLEESLESFGMRVEQSGESFENVLKVLHLKRCHPDLALFVQVNPVFCCPALVTEAMSEKIERITGVPVLSITYDGTSASRNHVVQPYLRHAVAEADMRRAS